MTVQNVNHNWRSTNWLNWNEPREEVLIWRSAEGQWKCYETFDSNESFCLPNCASLCLCEAVVVTMIRGLLGQGDYGATSAWYNGILMKPYESYCWPYKKICQLFFSKEMSTIYEILGLIVHLFILSYYQLSLNIN